MGRSTDAQIVAVLLAAGEARRFGGPKQLAPIDGVALVRRCARAIVDTGLPLVVVTGAHADAVAAALDGLALRLLHNPRWRAGMGGSIAVAVDDIARDDSIRGVLICLGDQPQIGSTQLRRLLDAHARAPDGITASDHGTVAGPPSVFARRYFAGLCGLSGDAGARALLATHASDVRLVPMPEAACDIDTPEQYRALRARQHG